MSSPSSPARRAEPIMRTPMPPIRPQTTFPPPPPSLPDLPRASAEPTSVTPLPHLPSSLAPAASAPGGTIYSHDASPSSNTQGTHTHTLAVAPMDTGTLNNNDEPPPAYTPIQ
ncbi:hypothetical protein BS17DRAFT_772010 [Gyrodon lividus]|nr:hypothetical protein BS17DRAFT_772010 [Gyrodon lividus]